MTSSPQRPAPGDELARLKAEFESAFEGGSDVWRSAPGGALPRGERSR
ncbi:hypothetical protein AB0D74_12140 [Streptomyces sp. NPDC048278]